MRNEITTYVPGGSGKYTETPPGALAEKVQELHRQLIEYVALLAKWNRTYNLTAIDDPLRMVSHHLLDSLVVLPHLPMPAQASLADAGSGAGLPGIPLAVARPAARRAGCGPAR